MNSEPKRMSQGAFDVTRMSEDDIADAIARQVDEIERRYGESDADAMTAPEPARPGSADIRPEPEHSGAPIAEDGVAQPDPPRDRWSSPYSPDFSSLIAADDAQSRVMRLLAMRLPQPGADPSEIVDVEDQHPAMRWRPSRAALLGSAALVLVLSAGGLAALWKSQLPSAPTRTAMLTVLPEIPESPAPVIVRRQRPLTEVPRLKEEKEAVALFYGTAAGVSMEDVQADDLLASHAVSPSDADDRHAEALAGSPMSPRERALHDPMPVSQMATTTETPPTAPAAELPEALPAPRETELGETTSGSGLRSAARIPRVDQPAPLRAARTIGAPETAIGAAPDSFIATADARGPWRRFLLLAGAALPGTSSKAPAGVGGSQGGTGRGAAGGTVLVQAPAAGGALPTASADGNAAANSSAVEASSYATAAEDSGKTKGIGDGGASGQAAGAGSTDAKDSGKTKGSGDGGTSGQAAGKSGAKADSSKDASGKGASKGNKVAGASGAKSAAKASAGALGGSVSNAGAAIAAGARDIAKDVGKAAKEASRGKSNGNGIGGSNGKAGSESGKSESKGGGKEGGKGGGDKGGGNKGGGNKGGGGKGGGNGGGRN